MNSILAIDPSIKSLGWAILRPPGKLEKDEVSITQKLYYCEKHNQLETWDEMNIECADAHSWLYLKKDTVMKAIGNGEFQGGGHCTSLDPSWYTTVIVPQLLEFGTVKRETQGQTPEQRMDSVIEGLEYAPSELDHLGIAVIEKPQLWGAYKSTASLHSGALLGLHILTGALYWWAQSHFERAYLIPVTEWKGQLPKRVTQQRMEQKYKVKFRTDDESDAVGLGDYFINTMNE